MDMEEVWRPIKRYEGLYEVSSYWRVRSVDRYDRRGTFHKGRILRIRKSGIFDGLYVTLSKNGVRKERDIGLPDFFSRRRPLPARPVKHRHL